MTRDYQNKRFGRHRQVGVLAWIGVLVWFAVIGLPLGWLFLSLRLNQIPGPEDLSISRYAALLIRTCLAAALVATMSVVVGWPGGRLAASTAWGRKWGVMLLAIPLLIPPQVIYYAWGLLLLPTSSLGTYLARSTTLAESVSQARSVIALGCWYWPLCSLILGMGWRRTDPDVWAQARLQASPAQRWWWIGLPMLRSAIVSAWLIVFVLAIAQFSVFHLAAIDTVGTELATLYQLTGSVHSVAWAALPLLALAGLVAAVTARFVSPSSQTFDLHSDERSCRGSWILAGTFWMASLTVPVLLLILHVQSWTSLVDFGTLSCDALLYSAAIAVGAAVLAIFIGLAVLLTADTVIRPLGEFMRFSTFVAALLPGSLIAVAMIHAYNRGPLADHVYNRPWIVSMGQAARLSIVAILMIWWVQASLPKTLAELARLDGAKGLRAAIYIWLPGLWPAIVAAMLLAGAMSMTELAATMVLLPAGVPNFAQQLLNQMHYARDQQVIASCLLLIAFAAAIVSMIFLVARLAAVRAGKTLAVLAVLFAIAGCQRVASEKDLPEVLQAFGSTGRGKVQFIYPRAITSAADGSIFVVDRAARVQHLSAKGKYLGGWTMPELKAGKPVGLSCGPGGNIYVADTHYYRVMIYSPDGRLVRQFGSFGKGEGQFIYPTDVAVGPDGRIFVSEYGGNDRISIFSANGTFIRSFGSFGQGENQFSRPSAICIDAKRKILYVADACNHRIVRYDLQGRLLGSFGRPGRGPGELRYPYDVNLMPDGTLIVCEYGNHRVQRFKPTGESLGTGGTGGRELGQLLHPWGAAVDAGGRVFILDSGNDRVQVWTF